MRTLNTTSGPRETPKGTRERVVNTSDVLEPPQLVYEDEEPEIVAVLPGGGYHAVVKGRGGERAVPLVAWVATDSGRMYGVSIGEDGRVDLVDGDIEKLDGFARYEQTNSYKEDK